MSHLGHDLSPAQWISLCLCSVPSVWGGLPLLDSLWEGEQVVDLKPQHVLLYKPVLTVNFNSMLRCNVKYSDGTKLVFVRCSVSLWYCSVQTDGLCDTDITCTRVVTDVQWQVVWWWMLIGTHKLCECKALTLFVSVCLLFKWYTFLPNVTCYSNCICVWKWICKEKHKYIT